MQPLEVCPMLMMEAWCILSPSCYWDGSCKTIVTTPNGVQSTTRTTTLTRSTTTLVAITARTSTTPLPSLSSSTTPFNCGRNSFWTGTNCQQVSICNYGVPLTAFSTSISDTICQTNTVCIDFLITSVS
jgi:hypothetical protein